MIVTILSEFDYANSGKELYLALKAYSGFELYYFKKNHVNTEALDIICKSDIIVFKGDNLPIFTQQGLSLYNTKGHKIIPNLLNLKIKPSVRIILLAGGSGFRRKDNGNIHIAKQIWPLDRYINSCDYITTITPDLNYPLLKGSWLPHTMDLSLAKNHWKQHRVLKVSYYPNYNDKKGTDQYLLPAVEKLKSQGYKVELYPIKGVSLDESIKIKQQSSIYFENISEAGCYGKSGVEALSNGIPTICYISEQSKFQALPLEYGKPILNASSVEEVYTILLNSLNKKLDLRRVSEESFYYAKIHDYKVVSKLFVTIANNVVMSPQKRFITILQKSQKTDIVIPYLKSTNSNLALVINSIKQNAQFEHRIVVIGDDPKIPGIHHIPHTRAQNITSPKLRDSYDKLKIIISEKSISEDFIYTYDDVYWNKPVTLEFFEKAIALNLFNPSKNGTLQGWAAHLSRTINMLHESGHTTWNYETHLPRLYNKEKIRKVLGFPGSFKNLLIATVYFNVFYNDTPILFNKSLNIKAGFYGQHSPYSYKDMGDLPKICDANIFINHNQAGITQNLKDYLNKFKDAEQLLHV